MTQKALSVMLYMLQLWSLITQTMAEQGSAHDSDPSLPISFSDRQQSFNVMFHYECAVSGRRPHKFGVQVRYTAKTNKVTFHDGMHGWEFAPVRQMKKNTIYYHGSISSVSRAEFGSRRECSYVFEATVEGEVDEDGLTATVVDTWNVRSAYRPLVTEKCYTLIRTRGGDKWTPDSTAPTKCAVWNVDVF